MVDNERARWLAAQRAAGVEQRFPDLVIDRSGLDAPSCLVLGDPGEADASQYAVVEPLLAVGRRTDFMVITSDVIYPAGDVNDYINGFFIPYEDYPAPIYALPGNHDWYALLNGFMYHFCGAEALPRTDYHPFSYPPAERRARRKWRQSSQPKRTLLFAHRRGGEPLQPAPYWALDAGPIRLVAIDVGVGDAVDAEQGAWLERVSRAVGGGRARAPSRRRWRPAADPPRLPARGVRVDRPPRRRDRPRRRAALCRRGARDDAASARCARSPARVRRATPPARDAAGGRPRVAPPTRAGLFGVLRFRRSAVLQ